MRDQSAASTHKCLQRVDNKGIFNDESIFTASVNDVRRFDDELNNQFNLRYLFADKE